MVRGYDSYLLRCWRLKNGTRRIAVEHVQSGERAVVASLRAAAVWMSERTGDGMLPEAEGGTDGDARRADWDGGRPAWMPELAAGNQNAACLTYDKTDGTSIDHLKEDHMTIQIDEPTQATRTQPTPERILQLGLGFWGAKTLLSAAELGVFSALADSPQDGETLRRRLGLHPRGARDFLDALVALGLLEREGDRYRNTPEADLFLDRAKPWYVGGMLEMANARLYPFWGALTEGLSTGRPQNEIKAGGNFFEVLYRDPRLLGQFLRAMTGISAGAARAIARLFPWEQYRTFVDVGCAEGCLPVQVALAHPHLAGGGFDLPPVRPHFEAHVATHGLGERLRFYPGDFLREPLPEADVLAMGHILHDWSLEEKRLLVAKAHAALPPGGALIVYDAVIDDERRQNAFGLLMSLNMLIETPGGFDYTGADCQRWLREAGFRETHVTPLVGPDSLVVGIK